MKKVNHLIEQIEEGKGRESIATMRDLMESQEWNTKDQRNVIDWAVLYQREDILFMFSQHLTEPFIRDYLYTIAVDKGFKDIVTLVKRNGVFVTYNPETYYLIEREKDLSIKQLFGTSESRYIDTEVSQNDINHPKWNPVRGFIEKRKKDRERKRERLKEGLPRDELVSHIIKTKNMTLGEASRYIKEQGLYKTSHEKEIEDLKEQLEKLRSQTEVSDDAV